MMFELGVVQRSALFKDGHRDPGLSDVVEDAGERQPFHVGMGKPEMPAEADCQAGYEKGVLIGLAMVLADGLDPGAQALGPDLADDGFACLVEGSLIERSADAGRS